MAYSTLLLLSLTVALTLGAPAPSPNSTDLLRQTQLLAPAGPLFNVIVNVDTSQASSLYNFGQTVKREQERWFPFISNYLNSPGYEPTSVINLFFDPKYDGVAYAIGNKIVGSVKFYEQNMNDVGSMIHEMVHVIQHYGNCPGWMTEGIADYMRNYHYEPNNNPPSKPTSSQHYWDSYKVTAYWLNYIQKTTGNLVYWINKDCRENTYNDSIFVRLTGKSPDDWWNEMLIHG